MRKKINAIIILLTIIWGFSDLFVNGAEIRKWEFIPEGNNYLSNDNCEIAYRNGGYELVIKYYLRVKANVKYSIANMLEDGVFDSSMYIDVYDEKLHLVQKNVSNELYNEGFSFTIPSSGKYISGCIPLIYYNDDTTSNIEDLFILYEGTISDLDSYLSNHQYSFGQLQYSSAYGRNSGCYYTDVDNPATVEEISNYLKAFDNVDGDVTDRIIVEENNYNPEVIGTYDITYSVSDLQNNQSTFTVKTTVVDNKAPTFSGSVFYNLSPLEPMTIDDFRQNIQISDNYDGSISNSELLVKEDTYSNNKEKIGSYTISFEVADSSNNVATRTLQINVKDKVKPIISGESVIDKNVEDELTIDDIKNSLTATDDYDGDVTNRISIVSNEYTGNETKLGSYKIVFKVTDLSLNSNTFEVTVNVNDVTPPVFYISEIIINLDISKTKLTNNMIKDALVKLGKVNADANVFLDCNIAEEKFDSSGNKDYTLFIDSKKYSLKINSITDLYESEIKNDSNVFTKIGDFFSKLFESIVNFMKQIF